jgi:hypothetical protein
MMGSRAGMRSRPSQVEMSCSSGVSQQTWQASARTRANRLSARWIYLCDKFLPFRIPNSFWRVSRHTRPEEPTQGWKLHISATVLQACDLFERVAPVLAKHELCYKAPDSLDELMLLNSGPVYGYWQVGKFLTLYPSTAAKAVTLAAEFHKLTTEFAPVSIPFDIQYRPNSNVFYRYGGFTNVQFTDENGVTLPAVENLLGELVYDDRLVAVPEWVADPFRLSARKPAPQPASPLTTRYRVFEALTQRGKGGTYQAIDVVATPPRLCVVKQGRPHGEIAWNGDSGRDLAQHECRNLVELAKVYSDSPRVCDSFESNGNFYFVIWSLSRVPACRN